MPELLLQSAVAASASKRFAADAAQITANCHTQHGDDKALLSCPQCYETLLEAFRARFLSSASSLPHVAEGTPPNQPPQQQQQQQQQREWFTTRRAFLSELDLLISSAKEYQISPHVIDDRVREERSRWYAENVRSGLLRLMVEDPLVQGAVFEVLEDLSSATAGSDPVASARELAGFLSSGPLAPGQGAAETDMSQRLLAVDGDAEHAREVLKDMFFKTDDGAVPEDHQKYLDMLLHQGMSMEQVVDRILEERQAATGAKEQTNKLNQRLDDFRRARAAHEAQKTRKAQRRESLAQQKVPDELYELPACTVCGEAPSTADFFCCSICTILTGAGIQDKKQMPVFCSNRCEEQGYAPHAEIHTCSSGLNCIQLNPNANTNPASEDAPMPDASASASPQSADIHFCTECLTTLKQPTTWCSLTCADANFQRHREEVHLSERKKLGLPHMDDGEGEKKEKEKEEGEGEGEEGKTQIEYLTGTDGNDNDNGNGNDNRGGRSKYRAKDIRALTTSLEQAVQEWEGRNRVRLQVQGSD